MYGYISIKNLVISVFDIVYTVHIVQVCSCNLMKTGATVD